ncbi:CocE/NonD family hydrolase [Candidatus Poribacteria bacterium]|nr:CocE/NonD family hydrolase [Candidatus Poribacteria bacterium]
MLRRLQTVVPVLAIAVLICSVPVFAVVHTRVPVDIPMSDGQSLGADVYLPPGAGPHPAILIQTPYNKDLYALTFMTELASDPLLKSPDYAFVTVDWRGFFDSSEADYQGNPSTGEDGFDCVEWIAAQSWCTGSVGTWGESALGLAQLLTALEKPPHLRACVPMVTHVAGSYEMWYPGGVYYKNRNDFVAVYFGIGNLYKSHPVHDIFWDIIESGAPDYTGIETPMLFVSGWYDHEPPLTIREFQAVRTAQIQDQTRLLIGPWSHSHLGDLSQGQLAYPAAEFGHTREALAFFDQHLRGIEPAGPPPVVKWFQTNEDEWLENNAWPPEPAGSVTFFLQTNGSMTPAPPTQGAGAVTYTSGPEDPVPTTFGALLLQTMGGIQGPGDVAPLAMREDVASFMTPVLDQPLRIAGNVTAEIWLEADAPDVDIAVRLTQVLPDGRQMILVDGIRRASFREGFETRQLLSPSTPYRIPVRLSPVAVTIPAGHRLGVLVASSNFDLFDVNPQDGSSFLDDEGAAPRSAHVSILVDPAHPSNLTVPVLPPDATGNTGWMLW